MTESDQLFISSLWRVFFITQRARLGATIQQDALSVRVVLQDVRAFGEEANTLTDFSADGLDAHFAYLQ